MNKVLKIVALAATAFISVGLVLSLIGYLVGGGFYSIGMYNGRPYAEKIFTNSKLLTEEKTLSAFTNIDVDVDYIELEMLPSNTGAWMVKMAWSEELGKPTVELVGQTLRLRAEDRNLEIRGNIKRQVTLYYPAMSEFESVSIHVNAANLNLQSFTTDQLTVSTQAGNINVKEVQARQADLEANAGSIGLKDCMMNNTKVLLMLGNLEASGFTGENLSADLQMGNVDLSGSLLGSTDLKLQTGSAELDLYHPLETYGMKIDCQVGSIMVDNDNLGNHFVQKNSGSNQIQIEVMAGSVDMSFE